MHHLLLDGPKKISMLPSFDMNLTVNNISQLVYVFCLRYELNIQGVSQCSP
jgi:hypothetical protein